MLRGRADGIPSWARQKTEGASALVQGEAGSAPRAAPTRVSHVAVTGRMLAGGALGAAPRVTPVLKVRRRGC